MRIDRSLLTAAVAVLGMGTSGAYAATQRAVDQDYRDSGGWWRRAILNTAEVGWVSSDRTILDYAGANLQAFPPA